jgi:hypothetical protein
MSQNHIDLDLAVEVFVLSDQDRPQPRAEPGSDTSPTGKPIR